MNVKYVLTDIEGTTSSISFVSDILFPYFREHIEELLEKYDNDQIKESFYEIRKIAQREQLTVDSNADIISLLMQWSLQDRKIKPLKDLQGILWKDGYESGILKSHVYKDVKPNFNKWIDRGLKIGIYSSGSVNAQKLLFEYSIQGNLNVYLSNYFDTEIGSKKECDSYYQIAKELKLQPSEIVFLSDSIDELTSADIAGMITIQLCRDSQNSTWKNFAIDFDDVTKYMIE